MEQSQQYQQQQQQQAVVHHSPKKMWTSKFILRVVSAIFDLILIGSSASLGTTWASPAIIFFLPPACIALTWNIAEGISILVRGGRRGIHPGACVGVDLILWLGFAASSVIYLLFGYGWYFYTYRRIFGGSTSSFYTLNRACLVVGFLEMIMHFALFVIACVETSKRNSASSVIIYQQPPPGMVFAPGYPPQPAVYQPDLYNQYNQHPHQSMVIPAAYQPAPQGYQAYGMQPQQANPNTRGKAEADSTPISVPSPTYEAQNERRS